MITLEEIAGYLPHGLKSVAYFDNNRLIRDVTLHNAMAFINDEINAKILLRPLSDLTHEIEHNGEKFVPYDMLKTIVSEEQWVKVCNSINDNYNKIADMPFWWVKTIILWHFDIYGLIDRGDAIDINSLT